jgi:hypothetical protein
LVIVVAWGLPAGADHVSLDQARTAAANWAQRTPPFEAKIGRTVAAARTVKDGAGEALFHVVRFQEGGFVVTAADDGIEPVIAFSSDDDLVEDARNPLWVLLNRDLPQRRTMAKKAALRQLQAQAAAAVAANGTQWTRLLATTNHTNSSVTALDASVSDLRVSPLLTTTWDQQTAYGGACYNYYVPPYAEGNSANDPCGCVATAGAQLMRYHQYPTASVSAGTYTIWVDGASSNATMKGGTYSWSNMATNPTASSTTLAQRQAVGKLTYDVGVACYMSYASSGSGAYDPNLVDAFKNRFGYTSAVVMMNQNTGVDGYLANAALANLDAKVPVIFGISGTLSGASVGHEIVGDGYGYSGGSLYMHLNLGWSGQYNAWYNLPVFTAYVSFTMLGSIVYNVFPTSSVEVISGRVLDSSGNPVSGATVAATNLAKRTSLSSVPSDSHGIYAFLAPRPSHASGTYQIVASLGSRSATKSATVNASASTTYSYSSSTASMNYSPGSGTVGNSWGNDLTLPDAAPNVPAAVSASDGTSTVNVTVTWAASPYATGYSVYRYTSDSTNSASLLGSVPGTTYTDATTAAGTLYYYWVKATNGSGSSAFSASDSGYRALAAPTGVSATDSAIDAVTMTWSAVTGASYYCVYRASSATTTNALGNWQTTLTYADTSAVPGTVYSYWVAAAVDSAGTRASALGGPATGIRLVSCTTNSPVPVPFAWLDAYGLAMNGDYEAAALADSDGDGMANWQEYVAGTDPTNGASVLQLTAVNPVDGTNGFVLDWNSASGRFYSVWCSTNLLISNFTALASGLPATPTINVWTDSASSSLTSRFYRIVVTTNSP